MDGTHAEGRRVRGSIGRIFMRIGQALRGDLPGSDDDPTYLPPLYRAETRALVDARAPRELKMSGDEFRRRLAVGDLPDTSAVRSLAILVGHDSK